MLTAINATTKTKSLAMCRSDTTPPYVASFMPSAEWLFFLKLLSTQAKCGTPIFRKDGHFGHNFGDIGQLVI